MEGCRGGGRIGPAFGGAVDSPLDAGIVRGGREGMTGVEGGEMKDDRLEVDVAGEGGADPSVVVGKLSG